MSASKRLGPTQRCYHHVGASPASRNTSSSTMASPADESRVPQVVAPARAERPSVARLIAGYGAVACALPYLALKVVWICGGTLGVADVEMMRETNMIVLNAVTAGMDIVGILIAMAFTHRWGMRMPAWLVLPPMWVATGLLAKFVMTGTASTVAELLASGSLPRATGGPVQPWVYGLVYTEFVGMGIGLMLAFVLYARTRWASVFQSTTGAMPRGATHGVQVPLANTAALMALTVGAFHLTWAFGATVGLARELTAQRTLSSYLLDGIDGALVIAAAVGIFMMVHPRGRHIPLWLPLAFAWVGAGSLFGWGLWHLVNVLPNTALVRERAEGMALFNFLALVRLLAGLPIGLVILFLLAERTGTPDVLVEHPADGGDELKQRAGEGRTGFRPPRRDGASPSTR